MILNNISVQEILDSSQNLNWVNVKEEDARYIQSLLSELKYDLSEYYINLLLTSEAFKNLPKTYQHHIYIRIEYLRDIGVIKN
jgi:hypothetical protein